MKKKKTLLLVVLLMAVGFAAVSTTLYINGTTKINANQDDFNVYYSDAKVNGVQDLSVVTDETHLTFTTTLETLGEKYVLDYDVTNGSKNYDAELVMECTEGNEYLSVTNDFDDENVLETLQTRSGKLTLEIIKSYAGESDMEVTISCTINANAIERDSLGEGEAENPILPAEYAIGDEITIAGEKFNVISEDKDTVTMLASNVLGTDYRQTDITGGDFGNDQYGVKFASTSGWEYTPGPKEIDVQIWSTNPKTYINEYVSYLQTETGASTITGDLITLQDLKKLGCVFPADYSYVFTSSERTCQDSDYADWLINNQFWWTRSAASDEASRVWYVLSSGYLSTTDIGMPYLFGIRPVITISKDALN